MSRSRVALARAFLALCAIVAFAQSTGGPGPAISAYYRMPGQTAGPYPYKWMLIDLPLTFSVDAAGSPHLGAMAAWVVRGEVPVKIAPMSWQLAHLPTGGVSCFRNGIYSDGPPGGTEYTRGGVALVSQFWSDTDTLRCDYETLYPIAAVAPSPIVPSANAFRTGPKASPTK